MKKNKNGYYFVAPFMVMFVMFLVVPTIVGLGLSFTDYNGMSLETMSFVGFDNYKNFFDPSSVYFSDFWESILRTLIFVILIVPPLIIIPIILSQLILSLKKGKGIIKGMFYIPVVLSVSGVATLAGWFFDQKYGLLNYFLSFGGIENIGWLTETTFAFFAIASLTVWWTMGGN